MNAKLDIMDQRLDGKEQKLENVEKTVGSINDILNSFKVDINFLAGKQTKTEMKVNRIEKCLNHNSGKRALFFLRTKSLAKSTFWGIFLWLNVISRYHYPVLEMLNLPNEHPPGLFDFEKALFHLSYVIISVLLVRCNYRFYSIITTVT
jgi:hypothetical protein